MEKSVASNRSKSIPQEAKMYAGIPSVEFDCTIVIMKQKIQ